MPSPFARRPDDIQIYDNFTGEDPKDAIRMSSNPALDALMAQKPTKSLQQQMDETISGPQNNLGYDGMGRPVKPVSLHDSIRMDKEQEASHAANRAEMLQKQALAQIGSMKKTDPLSGEEIASPATAKQPAYPAGAEVIEPTRHLGAGGDMGEIMAALGDKDAAEYQKRIERLSADKKAREQFGTAIINGKTYVLPSSGSLNRNELSRSLDSFANERNLAALKLLQEQKRAHELEMAKMPYTQQQELLKLKAQFEREADDRTYDRQRNDPLRQAQTGLTLAQIDEMKKGIPVDAEAARAEKKRQVTLKMLDAINGMPDTPALRAFKAKTLSEGGFDPSIGEAVTSDKTAFTDKFMQSSAFNQALSYLKGKDASWFSKQRSRIPVVLQNTIESIRQKAEKAGADPDEVEAEIRRQLGE